MSDHKGKDFSGQRVVLDGNRYENCKFENAQLIYNGGGPPALINCDVGGASVELGDAARRTAAFLVAMSHDPALNGFVRQLFQHMIR